MAKIISFANSAYAPILKKWLKYISNLGLLDNVLIIALDNKIKKNFVDYKIEIITDPFNIEKRGIKKYWEFRCKKFIEIYQRFGTFIHSDLDAIWLKNPFNYLSKCNYDLIFSQGTVYPRDMYSKFGFVACCGFFMIRKSNLSTIFLNEVLDDVIVSKDDQISVNKFLLKYYESFNFKDTYNDKATLPNGKNFLIKCSNYPIIGNVKKGNNDLSSFSILPHKYFTRLKNSINSETIIAHPLAPKDNTEKLNGNSNFLDPGMRLQVRNNIDPKT